MQFVDRLAWINPFHATQTAILTELPPAAVSQRLREAVVSRYSPRTWFYARADWPVIGSVSGSTFWIQRVHTLVRAMTLPQASGVVEPRATGSVIHLRLGMGRVNAILHVMLGAAVLLVALAGVLLFPLVLAPWPRVTWLLLPIAALLLYSLDRVWWAGDVEYLRGFVAQIAAAPHPAWRPYAGTQTS
ncbi:MAG: hypothetical protein M3003_12015 [Candidatus Dormibacteraeota bacterium]|nr:hypothetical protein [Candidatus Dormibacteraeota bacterium]